MDNEKLGEFLDYEIWIIFKENMNSLEARKDNEVIYRHGNIQNTAFILIYFLDVIVKLENIKNESTNNTK